jgi:hypothetical protein
MAGAEAGAQTGVLDADRDAGCPGSCCDARVLRRPRICAIGSKRRRSHFGRQIESVSPPNCGYARQGTNLNGDGSPPARR